MSIPTPRRRISSRTKKRCRVIKRFFCKALGTSSQLEDKTHSLIQKSISDLRQKVNGIESQLEKVSKHYHDLSYPEDNFNKTKNKPTSSDEFDRIDELSRNDLSCHETKVLYTATNSRLKKFDDSDNASGARIRNNMTMINENLHNTKRYDMEPNVEHKFKPKSKKRRDDRPLCDEEYYHYKKFAARHLANLNLSPKDRQNTNQTEYSNHKRNHPKQENQGPIFMEQKIGSLNKNDLLMFDSKSKKPRDKESCRRKYTDLDQEYISGIIKKQYKPIKVFSRNESDLSLFSAPVCRDREFSLCDKICYNNDLCSCCFDRCRKHNYKNIITSDISDMRSVCDARLYSSKKRNRRNHLKKAFVDYNNSDYYDLVPVKEKSSPKSRKKFQQQAENIPMTRYDYKEVPPSPRTQRPRLNLKAKVYDECFKTNHLKKCSSTQVNLKNKIEIETDNSFQTHMKSINKQKPTQPNKTIDSTSNDTTLNNVDTDVSADKTLDEIKDLLQNFLTVIKKDSIHNENNVKVSQNNGNHSRGLKETSELAANLPPGFNNNYGMNHGPQCNMPPVFPSSYCYPIMPVCPVNCLQNGYLLSNVSNTCNVCTKTTKEPKKSLSTCNIDQYEGNVDKETQERIREIYEIVKQNPKSFQKKEHTFVNHDQNKLTKNFTTRSAGDSLCEPKYHPNLKESIARFVSKSCEAIDFKRISSNYSSATVSDTFLERLSVEVTRSSTEYDPSSSSKDLTKDKTHKLKNMLKPWKWGKKKRDIIEELTESRSSIEDNIVPKNPPFRQNLINYAMHTQEYYDPSPLNQRYMYNPKSPLIQKPKHPNKKHYHRYGHDPHVTHFTPRVHNDPRYDINNSPFHYDNLLSSRYPNYDPNYHHSNMPQVPLCLKEIEVKSIGTQSERKMSLFKKFTQKAKVQDASQQYNSPPDKVKSGTFNWKTLQENAKKGMFAEDFLLKTQQGLDQKDTKFRNAVIKKIFHKRNPFSPRNLIIKTLLGHDPSSYGNPPKFLKPKMFV